MRVQGCCYKAEKANGCRGLVRKEQHDTVRDFKAHLLELRGLVTVLNNT